MKKPKHFDFAYEVTKEVYLRHSPKDWTIRYATQRWEKLPKAERKRLIRQTTTILGILKEQWGSL